MKPVIRSFYQKELMDQFGKLNEQIPVRLSLSEQVTFQIGYYHQLQELYTPRKKDE